MPLPNRTQDLPEKRYYDPSTEENWADILHNVLREVSTNALVSGTNRDQYDPEDGQLFVHTDGGRWYIGDGSDWIDLGEVGSGSTGNLEGSLTRVTTANQLLDALGNTKYIRIDGAIDVSGASPIEIPDDTCLFGMGTHRDTDGAQSGKLLDSSNNPTLSVGGDDVRLFGFAIDNESTADSAAAVETVGNATTIAHLSIFSGHDGIVGRQSTSTVTGLRVADCLLESDTGNSGSGVGVRVDGQLASQVADNSIRGFNTQIEVATRDAFITGNHLNDGPAQDIDVGIRTRTHRVYAAENRIDGGPQVAGIHCTNPGPLRITANQIEVGSGADGIWFDHDGVLDRTLVKHNHIGTESGQTGDVGIRASAPEGAENTDISENTYDSYNSRGFSTTARSFGTGTQPSTDQVLSGSITRNTDDDAIWTNLGESVHQLNRVDGLKALDIVEDPDTGTGLDLSLDVTEPTYGTYLIAGYINGGATEDNGQGSIIDINVNNNYDTVYDFATMQLSNDRVYTQDATAWEEQVWSRYKTPVAWFLHSGTEENPSAGDHQWITIHSVSHRARRGLIAGRAWRDSWRLESVQIYSSIPRFGGRFVLYGIDRDGVFL